MLEEKKINVNGVDINYVTYGKGPSHIVLLPSSLGTWERDFGGIIDKLNRKKYTVVGLDPPGHGKSRPPDRKYYEDYCKDDAKTVAQLMQDLNLTPFSVVGWNEGGRTAFHLAHDYPDLVKKVIEWGTFTRVVDELATFYDGLRNVENWSNAMRESFGDIYEKEYLQKTWDELCTFYCETAKVEREVPKLNPNEKDIEKGFLACRKLLKEINQPVMVLYGDQEDIGSSRIQYNESWWIAKVVKNGKLVVNKNAGNAMHQEPEHFFWFMRTMEDFLLKG